MKHLLLTVLALTLVASTAKAQESPAQTFGEVQTMVASGEKVKITDSTGQVIQGKLVALTPTSLRLRIGGTVREWRESDIREIQKRRHDPAWNGALYGTMIGGATGFGIAGMMCSNDPECQAITTIVFVPTGLAVGAATGALIDFSIRKFDTIFRTSAPSALHSIHLAPVLSRDRKGAALSFTF